MIEDQSNTKQNEQRKVCCKRDAWKGDRPSEPLERL